MGSKGSKLESDMTNPNPDREPYEETGEEDEENEDDNEDEEETNTLIPEARIQRLLSEKVPVRVHDIIVNGNAKTNDALIEAEVEEVFRDASSFQQLLRAASVANERLKDLDIFDSVNITLDAGPPELPGTANIVIEVVEAKNPLTGSIGVYSKPEARSWSLEGALKLKNLFGYGDIWDGMVAHGWGQTSDIGTGVSLPRFKGIPTPLSARISLTSQDWLKFSSYKERALGCSLGLLSSGNHDISYNLFWRTLTDPSRMSSHAVRRQLGHSLVSALKCTFKVDRRDSAMRPTKGHAFVSTTQIGGVFPDNRSLRFIRQEFDLRYAVPLCFFRTALNFGISGGVILPWGKGFLNTPSYLPERFFMGGNSSPVCSLIGPTSILGFKTRGLGPAEPRRSARDDSEGGNNGDSGIDHIGGDLALTAFADLSFDLPLKVLRDAGIHGHLFACTGSLTRLSDTINRNFTPQKFRDTFRSSVGCGIILPTKLFRMEVNYCYILKQHEHDQGKTGIQFCFSIPQNK